MIADVASGPMMTCLEVPKSAYITMAASATYSPATGVTPARSPKAIAEGTSTATTVMASNEFGAEQRGTKPFDEGQAGYEPGNAGGGGG